MYSGRIVRVTNLRRHNNADRLQCTEICGYNIIVDDTCEIGELLVFFPVGGELSEEFARDNHLKRRVTAVRIRGEISEGLALPVEVLGKYTDIHSLKEGDTISDLNGHKICSMYYLERMDVDVKDGKSILLSYSDTGNSPEKVYIPWGVEIIDCGAFMHSNRVKCVTIPETVTTIRKRAFYGCPNLRKVVIPDSLTYMGEEVFDRCEKLEGLTIPYGAKPLEKSDFLERGFKTENGRLIKYTGDDRDVTIPEGVTEIGKGAFFGKSRIESLVIPEGVTRIENHAFEECRGLRQVSFPHSVKYIGYQAFYKCRGLREVVIPSNVEYIGEHAFGKYFFFKYLPRAKFPYEEYRTYKNFRIICEKGSAAERYAKENGQTFYLI